MSSFTEILNQMGHACLTLSQDARVAMVDEADERAGFNGSEADERFDFWRQA